mmetsp:Transcript_27175/g.84188  ORF Transcript_27175/g.84188 Transcript_27175/m.84188 type:complete len:518 (-) Transcript_27175:177-1730(-)
MDAAAHIACGAEHQLCADAVLRTVRELGEVGVVDGLRGADARGQHRFVVLVLVDERDVEDAELLAVDQIDVAVFRRVEVEHRRLVLALVLLVLDELQDVVGRHAVGRRVADRVEVLRHLHREVVGAIDGEDEGAQDGEVRGRGDVVGDRLVAAALDARRDGARLPVALDKRAQGGAEVGADVRDVLFALEVVLDRDEEGEAVHGRCGTGLRRRNVQLGHEPEGPDVRDDLVEDLELLELQVGDDDLGATTDQRSHFGGVAGGEHAMIAFGERPHASEDAAPGVGARATGAIVGGLLLVHRERNHRWHRALQLLVHRRPFETEVRVVANVDADDADEGVAIVLGVLLGRLNEHGANGDRDELAGLRDGTAVVAEGHLLGADLRRCRCRCRRDASGRWVEEFPSPVRGFCQGCFFHFLRWCANGLLRLRLARHGSALPRNRRAIVDSRCGVVAGGLGALLLVLLAGNDVLVCALRGDVVLHMLGRGLRCLRDHAILGDWASRHRLRHGCGARTWGVNVG